MTGMMPHGPDYLLVLGFIAATLIAAIVIYPKVQAQERARITHEQLDSIARKLDTALVTSWTTDTALGAGVFPATMLDASSKGPFDLWGGPVTLESRASDGGTVLTLADVPGRDCPKLVTDVPAAWPRVLMNGHEMAGDAARQHACLGARGDYSSTMTVAFVHTRP